MKTTTRLIGLICLLYSQMASAYSPEAYPGSLWNNTTHDFDRFEGFGNQGNLTQGVQWLTLPGEIPVITFASYRWRLRSQNQDFYNAHGPAAGVEFRKLFFNFGFEFEWQTYPVLETTTQNGSFYLTWYKRMRFIGGDNPTLFGLNVVGFPTTTWGRLNYDFENLEGAGAMGFLTQAIDWVTLPGDIVLRTQATYNWRFRSKNNVFFNMHGPSAGIEFARDTVNLGVEYGIQHYTELNENVNRFQVYLNWFFDWGNKSN